MSTPAVRLLPFATGDGPAHMAADESLLASARAGAASLRFYAWSGPTVSLGYFQPSAARLADPLLAGLPFVRRPTGGGALVHHHELTYALSLPAGPEWHPPGPPWPCRMHQVVAAALADLGVATDVGACAVESGKGEFLCFRHHTPGDLLCRGHKVAGSAQRRQRGGWLQHGGVLLARSPHAPALPGLSELAGASLDPKQLAVAVAAAFSRATAWAVEPGGWTPEERVAAADLAANRYRDPAWNGMR